MIYFVICFCIIESTLPVLFFSKFSTFLVITILTFSFVNKLIMDRKLFVNYRPKKMLLFEHLLMSPRLLKSWKHLSDYRKERWNICASIPFTWRNLRASFCFWVPKHLQHSIPKLSSEDSENKFEKFQIQSLHLLSRINNVSTHTLNVIQIVSCRLHK